MVLIGAPHINSNPFLSKLKKESVPPIPNSSVLGVVSRVVCETGGGTTSISNGRSFRGPGRKDTSLPCGPWQTHSSFYQFVVLRTLSFERRASDSHEWSGWRHYRTAMWGVQGQRSTASTGGRTTDVR